MTMSKYNELRKQATAMGIRTKGMKMADIESAIHAASEASRNISSYNNPTPQPHDDNIDPRREDWYDTTLTPADHRHAPVVVPVIQFVKADNTQVYYRVRGVLSKIWIADDGILRYRDELHAERKTSPAAVINAFKKYMHGRDGDVKQVVAAFVRIKKRLIAAQQKARVLKKNVSSSNTTENQQPTRRRGGTVDAEWLAWFRVEFADINDRQPNGPEIQAEWRSYCERQA